MIHEPLRDITNSPEQLDIGIKPSAFYSPAKAVMKKKPLNSPTFPIKRKISRKPLKKLDRDINRGVVHSVKKPISKKPKTMENGMFIFICFITFIVIKCVSFQNCFLKFHYLEIHW